jgi:hypothetical protein
MNQESMVKPALIGGVAIGILSAMPKPYLFNCGCCLWVIAGGLLAAYLHVKESSSPISLGRGAALGLLTGALGATVAGLFSIPFFLLSGSAGKLSLAAEMRQQLDKMPAVPPETRQIMESLASGGALTILFIILGFFLSLIAYSLFAMLGGAIGVALFEKRTLGTPPVE